MENPNHPELKFCENLGIKTSKRDEFLNFLIKEKGLKLIAIAGTHGKTTTTAMVVWLFKQLNLPVSYSVGAKLSFGEMGEFDEKSEYFVYEADEFDRNFLEFSPDISLITGIDYDHPDIYPTRKDYYQAFVNFINQSQTVFSHPEDFERVGLAKETETISLDSFTLTGEVNRKNAQLAVDTLLAVTNKDASEMVEIMNKFPGLSRRFEEIAPNIYSDYAHTPEKIRGAIQTALEVNDNVVVVYEGLHNTRQHFIKDEIQHLFDEVKKLYVVPSYLAREDKNLEMLTPEKLVALTSKPENARAMQLDDELKEVIEQHSGNGDLVLCLTAGGGGSLDEWLRKEIKT